MTPHIVVIGAGSAGLTAAIDLRLRGNHVTLFDGNAQAGGKIRTLRAAGREVDSGPTVLTMRWVFDQLFADAGQSLDAHVSLQSADVLARHAWADGSTLDLFRDVTASQRAIAAFANDAEADAYGRFMVHAQRVYETVRKPFLHSQRPTRTSLIVEAARLGLSGLMSVDGLTTLDKRLRTFFKDERLIQLFGRYATYVGSSPFSCPATLALIAYVEQEGVHFVRGGMRNLVCALESLARDLGVVVRTGEPVSRIVIESGHAAGVFTPSEFVAAHAVVYAGDAAALAAGDLGADAKKAVGSYDFQVKQRSLSALTLSMVAETSGFELAHHNVFFGNDSAREFGDMFERQSMPASPSVYICAQDRENAAFTAHAERLFFIVNAPAAGHAIPESEIERCRQTALNQLASMGLNLKVHECITTRPGDFDVRFPRTGGALYGLANHDPTAFLKRPGARTTIPGLYLAGGSMHPGAGVPMAALSGRLAAQALSEDFVSTKKSRPMAIAGSM